MAGFLCKLSTISYVVLWLGAILWMLMGSPNSSKLCVPVRFIPWVAADSVVSWLYLTLRVRLLVFGLCVSNVLAKGDKRKHRQYLAVYLPSAMPLKTWGAKGFKGSFGA